MYHKIEIESESVSRALGGPDLYALLFELGGWGMRSDVCFNL